MNHTLLILLVQYSTDALSGYKDSRLIHLTLTCIGHPSLPWPPDVSSPIRMLFDPQGLHDIYGSGRVPKTRVRVLDPISELGLVPNAHEQTVRDFAPSYCFISRDKAAQPTDRLGRRDLFHGRQDKVSLISGLSMYICSQVALNSIDRMVS